MNTHFQKIFWKLKIPHRTISVSGCTGSVNLFTAIYLYWVRTRDLMLCAIRLYSVRMSMNPLYVCNVTVPHINTMGSYFSRVLSYIRCLSWKLIVWLLSYLDPLWCVLQHSLPVLQMLAAAKGLTVNMFVIAFYFKLIDNPKACHMQKDSTGYDRTRQSWRQRWLLIVLENKQSYQFDQ